MANEKRLLDASPNDCIKKTKRKTNFAKIIVSGTAEKPYYDIMWLDYMDGQYHIGYGSYNLSFVFQWLTECFEILDAPTVDAVEVVHGEWSTIEDDYCGLTALKCSECNQEYWFEDEPPMKIYNYCPNCGAKMDGDGND